LFHFPLKKNMNEQEQWARLIANAWSNPSILANLRQDPKTEIERLQAEKPPELGDISDLGSGAGGFFAIPDLPEGLGSLTLKELEQFLSENPGIFGIMQLCCI
jgi:hypothetical protein